MIPLPLVIRRPSRAEALGARQGQAHSERTQRRRLSRVQCVPPRKGLGRGVTRGQLARTPVERSTRAREFAAVECVPVLRSALPFAGRCDNEGLGRAAMREGFRPFAPPSRATRGVREGPRRGNVHGSFVCRSSRKGARSLLERSRPARLFSVERRRARRQSSKHDSPHVLCAPEMGRSLGGRPRNGALT